MMMMILMMIMMMVMMMLTTMKAVMMTMMMLLMKMLAMKRKSCLFMHRLAGGVAEKRGFIPRTPCSGCRGRCGSSSSSTRSEHDHDRCSALAIDSLVVMSFFTHGTALSTLPVSH